MLTTLFLVRHGATFANLAHPPILQGRTMNPPLAPEGVRQAWATAALLGTRDVVRGYSSPMLRATQTLEIVCQNQDITTHSLDLLTECDLGAWEGSSWEAVRRAEPQAEADFRRDPAAFGYRGGENFDQVHRRAAEGMERIARGHPGETIVVVSHNIVLRTFLAGLMGLPPSKARSVLLDNCGVSKATHDADGWKLRTLNSAFHL